MQAYYRPGLYQTSLRWMQHRLKGNIGYERVNVKMWALDNWTMGTNIVKSRCFLLVNFPQKKLLKRYFIKFSEYLA
jgi:hypothetical protein